jgi:YbbR domain-containing protein
MDKLMDNPWFLKGAALLLALLLFSNVSSGGEEKGQEEYVPASRNIETIENVPVKSYFDTKNFVVSGVPETVDVTIEGPKSIVQSTKTMKNFEVYVDLSDAKIGTQKVKLKVKNISDKLKVTIKPATAIVTVQEKITKEFKVEAEFNQRLLEDGYTAGHPVVEPSVVEITGAKEEVEKISYVKATVDVNGPIDDTISKRALVVAFDKQLNKLDVTIQPETVKVTIPVKSSDKTVPINVIQKGTAHNGVVIDSIILDQREARIIGKEEVVKATDSVRVEVDISQITDDTEIELPVIIPNGITKVTPELVKATIKVSKQEEKKVSNVPIRTEGLGSGYDVVFNDPANGKMTLIASGPSETVQSLSASDINLFVNVSNLGEGNHEVPITANGPANVSLKLDKVTAKISIMKKAAV